MDPKKTLAALALGWGIAAAAPDALAAPEPVDILIQRLVERNILSTEDAESIRAEIAAIERETAPPATPARPAPAVAVKNPVRLSGYIQTCYIASEQDGVNDGLEARRVRLTLAGDATPSTDYRFQAEFAGSRRAQTSSTQTNLFSRPILVDGVVGVKLPQATRLQLGQFTVPFGSESLASSTNFEFVNRSAVTEALAPGRDNGAQGRDIGLQLTRAFPAGRKDAKVEAAVAVFNGGGINTGDDNEAKDLAARLNWKTPAPGLSLAAHAYDGRRGANKQTRDRHGVEVLYNRNPWFVRAESIWAKDAAVKKRGYYATVGYAVAPRTQAVIRYDRLDPNTALQDDDTGTLTLGLNRFLSRDGLQRWQLNYERRQEEGASVDNDQILAQFQLGF